MQLAEVRSAPAPVQLGELGFFDRAGVFFVDVSLTPALIALQQRVVAITSAMRIRRLKRVPSIPISRLPGLKDQGRAHELRELRKTILNQPAFSRFIAHDFLLYESHLSAEGAHYEVLKRFPFARP